MKDWNHRFGIRLITLLATLFWSGSAIAVDSFLTSFQNQYPTSTTGTTAWSSSSGRCNVCHSSGGGTPLNSYGAAWAIRLNAGRTVTQAFVDIEGDNSDGSSVNNISEITANAQPGWSPGATNTLYDLFSPGTAILFNQDPPTSLVGDVDPAATPTPTPTPTPPAQSLNVSTRLDVGTGDKVSIGGIIITPGEAKKVLLRAIGPSLSNFGIADPLADPVLELHAGDGSLITSNDNWTDSPQMADIEATGLAPTNDLESAIIETLNPGLYTAVVTGKDSGTGVGLVEAYDLDQSVTSQLGNLSTRGFVDIGNNVMIGGFILGPDDALDANVLVRAIGPSLVDFGVTDALADPVLELHDANGTLLVSNDNWRSDQETEIEATGLQPTNDLESAILMALAPGGYTAVVSGSGGSTGVALVEVYRLP